MATLSPLLDRLRTSAWANPGLAGDARAAVIAASAGSRAAELASLSAEQEAVIVALLDVLAFDEGSADRDFAMQVLEEYWVADALYRNRPAGDP